MTNGQTGPQPVRADRPRAAAMRVLREVVRAEQAEQSVQVVSLVEVLGGHPNAVRAQLDVLMGSGFLVEVPAPVVRRGRPARTFRATVAGRQVALADPARDDQIALIEAVAEQIAEGPDPRTAALRLGRAWGRRVRAGRAASSGSAPASSTDPAGDVDLAADADPAEDADAEAGRWDVTAVLAAQGFTPERTLDGLLLRTCPLLVAAQKRPDVVCTIHQGLLDTLSERPAELRPFSGPGGCRIVWRG